MRRRRTPGQGRLAPPGGVSNIAGTHDSKGAAGRLAIEKGPTAARNETATLVVNASFRVVRLHGKTDLYFATPRERLKEAGLVDAVRPELRFPVMGLIRRLKKSAGPIRKGPVQVDVDGHAREVLLKAWRVRGSVAPRLAYLVVFEEKRSPRPPIRRGGSALARLRESASRLREEHEVAVAELLMANEKARESVVELREINDALEDSKEEFVTTNEELTVVNDQLFERNQELGGANSDLTNLIGNVEVAIVFVGRDLCIRRFSPMAGKLLSLIPSDVGRPLTDIRMMVGVSELEALLKGVIQSVDSVEREVMADDGRWYALRVRPYLTPEREVDGAVLVMADVDTIRRAREASESIVATVREPILVLDRHLRVLRANRSYYQCFGATAEQTEGRFIHELGSRAWNVPELLRLLGDVQLGRRIIEDFVVEHEFERLGPKAMQINARQLLVPGERDPAILVAIEDVTDRRHAERDRAREQAELRRRADDLEAANRAKAEFIAMLSHELRTPLNAIAGWAEILKRDDISDDDRRKGVSVIARNSRLQARLISDLLDLHRIASGKLSLELRDADVRSQVEAAVEAALPSAEEKRIRLSFEADGQAAPIVRVDAARIQQVLGNLLSNAIKFTPEQGTIGVSLREQDGGVEIRVRDSGQGIDAETLPRIFERFRQFELLAARAHGSLGLGLSVSRQLVELHGGSIHAESAGRGEGATFVVRLPVAGGARPVVAQDRVKPPPVSLRGVLVLVVDDDPEAREPVRRVLEDHGAEVLAVKSADEALEALQQGNADVLVSDIHMPGRDGYQLMRAIRALPAGRGGRIPAVALTAFGSTEDRERARSAGYATHLVKPVEPADLVAAIAALLPAADHAP